MVLDSTSSVHRCDDSVVSPSSDKSSVFRLRSLTANLVSSSVRSAAVSVEQEMQFTDRQRVLGYENPEVHHRHARMSAHRMDSVSFSFVSAMFSTEKIRISFSKRGCLRVPSDQDNPAECLSSTNFHKSQHPD